MFISRQHQRWCGGGLYWHASPHKSKVQIRKWTIQKSSTSDRYSSMLGECGDSCILMQTWQFNYLCLTWRWKGSESLRAHVHFTVGFFPLNDPMNHTNARRFGKHSTFGTSSSLTWIHSWNQTWLDFVFITPFALLSLNDVAFTKVYSRFNGLKNIW